MCNLKYSECTHTHNYLITMMIDRKIAMYTKTDKYKIGETMTANQALVLLLNSGGKCTECHKQLLLHSWPQYHPDQFSFDRLDDTLSHSADNVRITCLGCNLDKAKKMYDPDTRFLTAYEKIKSEYFLLQKLIPLIPPTYSEFPKKRAQKCKHTLYYLHEMTYGGRKDNLWEPVPGVKLISEWSLTDYDYQFEWDSYVFHNNINTSV